MADGTEGHVPGPELLGTRLRLLLDRLDGDVGAVYEDLGLPGFRPRYTPVLRALAAARGPLSVTDLAGRTGVSHSAASQTVALLAGEGLVARLPGEDARHRLVRLTAEAERLLPLLDAEAAATTAAAAEFESELSCSLSALIGEALVALDRRPMRARIADHGPRPTAAPGRPVAPVGRTSAPVVAVGGSRDEQGGDPACMLDLVCPACGRVCERRPRPSECPTCGEPFDV